MLVSKSELMTDSEMVFEKDQQTVSLMADLKVLKREILKASNLEIY